MFSKENFFPSKIKNDLLLNLNCKIIYLILNLIFNGLIIRRINLNLIGIANIRLELFYSTILFLSRESLRHYSPKLNNIHSIYHYINLIWLILPFGFIFIFFSLFLTLFISINHTEEIFPYCNQACFIYAIAAFIQLLSEPLYLLAKLTDNHRINIFFEFIAAIIGFSFQTLFILKNPKSALLYYGIGYIIYSMLITSLYYVYFWLHQPEDRQRLFLIRSLNDLLIKPTSPFIDDKFLDEIFKSLKKGISIRILTEGEKYLITMFSLISYEEQGIYSVIYQLGIIFPRLIYSIIEQIISNYFQQTFSIIKYQSDSIEDDQIFLKNYSKLRTSNEERTLILNALTLLDKLIRLWMTISFILIILVIPHSSTIINIYMGENLSKKYSLIQYLRLYLLEIFLNGINVLHESFLQSIISNKQLNHYQNSMLFYSFIYLILCFLFTQLFGISGIILINCFNLFGRILFNNYLINQYTIGVQWLKSYLFSSHYIFVLFISLIIFYLNQILIENNSGQLLFAMGFILIIICLTLAEEKETIHYIHCVYKLNNHK